MLKPALSFCVFRISLHIWLGFSCMAIIMAMLMGLRPDLYISFSGVWHSACGESGGGSISFRIVHILHLIFRSVGGSLCGFTEIVLEFGSCSRSITEVWLSGATGRDNLRCTLVVVSNETGHLVRKFLT